MKILVLGASGQLGNCLKKVSGERNIIDISFPSEDTGNILNVELLRDLFTSERPAYVVNCAAYTAVDKAEEDIETCRRVNKDGAGNVAELCKTFGAKFIQISTDFVFQGNVAKLLSETDPTEPTNIYGITKLEGEHLTANILAEHFIIRTSWLYSEFGNNFVKTMLRLAGDRDQLSVIVDQMGSPTYAIDLAGAILDLIAAESKAYGIYHYSNEGAISWYDFAKAIFHISDSPVKVNPVRTTEYVTKATRPAFSVMDKTKIKNELGVAIPYWRDSLEECLHRLKSSEKVIS
ncbi:dTDP-4-dehydrorhamnose reductase [Dyadobacter sp. CY351]|uniref:dTDP-4-dehydrorhamnose reductase n=1 Tax=Dyadobacter sp. CY351 TaxID=2909337 RepID=UPI001F3EB058|nr:dTDP-4-dehydrorhamnose reductase [Dyadobacter sp. CY351]MCF2518418.1 dTDP-4-dehydrorhamnose reductase [Dyadobacter sp. CY351]